MSFHLEGMVRMRVSFIVPMVSHFVSMVMFIYVTSVITEFRYTNVYSQLFIIMT